MEELVKNLAALKERIQGLSWMSEDQGQGHRQVGNLHPEDRLPGQVA